MTHYIVPEGDDRPMADNYGFVVTDGRRSAGRSGHDLTQLSHRGHVAFRVQVHKDYYDFQSSGVLEMWTPAGWTNVVTLHGPHVTDVDVAAAALYEQASLVLDTVVHHPGNSNVSERAASAHPAPMLDLDALEEAYQVAERRYRDAGAALETPLTAYIAGVVRARFPDAATLSVYGMHNAEGGLTIRLSRADDAAGQPVAGWEGALRPWEAWEAWLSLGDDLDDALHTLGEITGSSYEGRHDIDLDSRADRGRRVTRRPA